MAHEDIEGLIPAYSVGAADPAERELVEKHLAGCESCRAILAEYAELSGALGYIAPFSPAPANLRDDLARRIALGPAAGRPDQAGSRATERPWYRLLRGSAPAWAGLALSVLLLFATNLYWSGRNRQMQAELSARATTVALVATAPKEIALRAEATAPGANGAFYFDPGARSGVLRVSGLPQAAPDKAYQVWLIHGSERQSGGLFRLGADGSAVVTITVPQPLQGYEGLGITLEPAQGSPGPTSPRLIGGRF